MINFSTNSMKRFGLSSFQFTPGRGYIAKKLTELSRRASAYREIQKLRRLDSRMLKDIGLYRADLDWAMEQSSRMEPTKALQQRRDELINAEHLKATNLYCSKMNSKN